MRAVLRDTGRVNLRACPLSHEVLLWVVLARGLLPDLPIRQVFRHAVRRVDSGTVQPVRGSTAVERGAVAGTACAGRAAAGDAGDTGGVLFLL